MSTHYPDGTARPQPLTHPLTDPITFPLEYKRWLVDYLQGELELSRFRGYALIANRTGGPAGPAGPTGAQGPTGQGVPAGGSAGQVLVKLSDTSYDTVWATVTAGGGSGGLDGGAPDSVYGGTVPIDGGTA